MKVTEFFNKYLQDNAKISICNEFGSILYNGTVGHTPFFLIKDKELLKVEWCDGYDEIFIDMKSL